MANPNNLTDEAFLQELETQEGLGYVYASTGWVSLHHAQPGSIAYHFAVKKELRERIAEKQNAAK